MRKAQLFLAGVMATLPLAAAADPAVEMVEGPYLDAGTGANFSRDEPVYNNSGQQVGTLQYDGGVPGTLAAGYALSNGWRGDFEFGFRRNDVDDSSSFASNGSVDASTMMAMLWFDWPVAWKFKPSFGAGAGQGELDLSGAPGAGSGETDRVFAYQFAAGMVGMLTRHLALSLSYRLVHTDEARFAGAGTRAEYESDAAMLGLRYFFRPVQRIRLSDAGSAAKGAGAGAAAEVAAFEVVLRPVNFKFDRDELTEPAKHSLDELASRLAKAPEMKVTVDGHTDFIGSSDYNMALGERRANAVRDYLAAKGVNLRVVEVRSFGETQPVDDNQTAEGRAVNRRAQITTAEAPPQNVRVRVEAPTEASKAAAQGPEDPLTRREQQGDESGAPESAPAQAEPQE
jgi:OmpA-OmpF porin, OOP family